MHPKGGVGQNTTVFTYDLLDLSLPPTARRVTVVWHHSHNQFRLPVWVEDNIRTEPSQGNNNIRNMKCTVKEVIHNNINVFLATKLQSGITIGAVSDGYYHPT